MPWPQRTGWVLALVGWCWLALAAWAATPTPTITASLNLAEAWPKDQLELTIIVEATGDLSHFGDPTVQLKPVPGLTWDSRPSSQQLESSQNPDGVQVFRDTIRYYVTCVDAGTYTVGPIELHYRDEAQERVVRVAGPDLTVKDPNAPAPNAGTTTPNAGGAPATPPAATTTPPAATDPADETDGMHDIKNIAPAPFDFGVAFAIIGLVLVLGLSVLIYNLLKNRKPEEKPIAVPYVAPMGLFQRTLERLDAIAPPATLGEQMVADYYLAVTALLKEYLAERYGISAEERTSWELRQDYRVAIHTRRPDALNEFIAPLQAVFDLCDAGKYAHLHRAYAVMADAKTRARTFLETDHRLAETITAAQAAMPPGNVADEPGLEGAAAGMKIKSVRRADAGPVGPPARRHNATPHATRIAEEALAAPSTSSTLFTPADSATLINSLISQADQSPAP
ncbi:MAG: hypothetical protein ABI743_03225 [bacterium]